MSIRLLPAVFAVVLAYFTAVQYNDPDALLWIAFYGSCTVVAMAAALGRFSRAATIAVMVIGVGTVLWLSPAVFEWLLHHRPGDLINGMSPKRPYIEQARECLGSAIATAMMIDVYRQMPATPRLGTDGQATAT